MTQVRHFPRKRLVKFCTRRLRGDVFALPSGAAEVGLHLSLQESAFWLSAVSAWAAAVR
jgi:hypothetical protein